MKCPHYIFREYDIRGKANVDLTNEMVKAIGKAFGSYVTDKGYSNVVVGRDNRLSSDRIRKALIEGLISTGCHVVDIGLVVTPILYYLCLIKNINAGVMITGSHNPPEENGFKLVCGSGTIYGQEIQRLRLIIESERFKYGQGTVVAEDPVSDYMYMLYDKIQLGSKKLKVAVDCGNGTAALFAEKILKGWGCNVIPLYCKSDGSFPNHEPDPVKTVNLRDLRRAVLAEGCDLGVAYDGDADRIGVVDDQGNIIWGDSLMILYWREILPKYPGTPCIIEVKCSQALVDEVLRMGGQPFFYKTGHSLIKAKMKEIGAVFTGEMSGHIFFADEYLGYDDAFYATGRLLRILSGTKQSLSELLKDVPQYYSTAETRIPCAEKDKFDVVVRLKESFRENYHVIDVDGVRVLFNDGWGLVRASNTQSMLVARCEAKTPVGLSNICKIIMQALQRNSQIAKFDWEF